MTLYSGISSCLVSDVMINILPMTPYKMHLSGVTRKIRLSLFAVKHDFIKNDTREIEKLIIFHVRCEKYLDDIVISDLYLLSASSTAY